MADVAKGARVLVVDDEDIVLRIVARILGPDGYSITTRSTVTEAIELLTSSKDAAPDVILTDLHLQDGTGLEILAAARAECPDAVTVVMSGRTTIGSAVEAMRSGAYDCLSKPFDDPQILSSAVGRALGHKRLLERNRYLEQRLGVTAGYEGLVGSTRAMREVISLVDTVAPTDANVLVQGESGTGKELVVRAIHDRSRRDRRAHV